MLLIPEKDWKVLRDLKASLLNSACESIFQRIEQISATRKGQEHESYLQLWKLIKQEDDAIAQMFDDLKRSKAILKIATMKRYGVLSDAQLALFSAETQENIKRIVG